MKDIVQVLNDLSNRLPADHDSETHVIRLNIVEVREIQAHFLRCYRTGVVLGINRGIEIDGSQANSEEEIKEFAAALNKWGKEGGTVPTPAWEV